MTKKVFKYFIGYGNEGVVTLLFDEWIFKDL